MGKPYGTEGIVVWFGFYMQVILFLLCMFSIACSIYPSSLITLHYIENYFPKQGTEQMPSFIICSSVFKVSHDSFCPGCVLKPLFCVRKQKSINIQSTYMSGYLWSNLWSGKNDRDVMSKVCSAK